MLNNKVKKIAYAMAVLLLFVTGCQKADIANLDNIISNDLVKKEEDNIVTISAVGDVMAHTAQLKAQMKEDGTYSFQNNFKYIKDVISNSDLAIANLETTINPDRPCSGYPSFNAPRELITTLKETGFDIVSTINNHSLDTGYNGLISTVNEIKNQGLDVVGTKANVETKNYIIKKVKDINIGIASFSYGDIVNGQKHLNGIKSAKANDLMNVINVSSVQKSFDTIKKEIDLMREEGAEFITIMLHWGKEYEQTPNNYQKQLAQLLANEGVDLILGSHPHVVQPIEFIKSENTDKECLVVYSMGNIISNQREEEMGFKESENGIIPVIDLEKSEDNIVKIKDVKYIPTWVDKYNVNNKDYYEIIPIIDDISSISLNTNASVEDLQISKNNTTSLIKDERVNLYTKE